jgi:hypothetical protein
MITSPGYDVKKRAGRLCMAATLAALLAFGLPFVSNAAPIEYAPFASIEFEGFFGSAEGRAGFQRETGALGTLNDLQADLGLPAERRAYRLSFSVRPLEHHVLRVYGTAPEHYKGSRVLLRELRTRNAVYEPGTEISSQLETAAFGFGYDLDFIVGPRWYAGFNGDFRYIRLMVRLEGSGQGFEDTLAVDEMIPCIGTHVSSKMYRLLGRIGLPLALGGTARMTYGMTPNFVNYVDIHAGLTVDFTSAVGPVFNAKVGFQREIFFHDLEPFSGRIFETSRNGLFFTVGGAF